MRKIKPWTPVIVEWEDAIDMGTHWTVITPELSLAEYKPVIRRTCAHFVAQNADVVIVAVDDDRAYPDAGQGAGVSRIPMGMVRKIIPLTEVP